MDFERINGLLELYASGFEKVLYEEDGTFLEGMKKNNLAGDDINRYRFWEWTQGVGLYGFWKLYRVTGEEKYLAVIEKYYESRIEEGLPGKNVNTVTPMLTLSFLAEHGQNKKYMALCEEWAEYIMKDFPRTDEGGLQHITSDTLNEGEIWDDTLFMTVLFLANMGRILNRREYIDEASYQFILHAKYLSDKKTGLWYHGWTFKEKNNFAGAFWLRGNCWITAAIPEFLQICGTKSENDGAGAILPDVSVCRILTEILNNQIEALDRYQSDDGMWHTIIDDISSYKEASGSCGAAYGILKAVHMGMIDAKYKKNAIKLCDTIASLTDAGGVLDMVSYGTPMGRESKDFYKTIPIKPMPYGQALAMLYFIELREEM